MRKDYSEVMCCICGKPLYNGHHCELSLDDKITYMGNNPWPVNEDSEARCCDECNMTVVIPARIKNMKK